jgi:hypothetical protein
MAISSLLRRMGFLKLDAYGLILTPEGRVLSTRSTVLDDGLGGKIVGWREGDLAAMELDRWQAPPAIPRATANPIASAAPLPPSSASRKAMAPPHVHVMAPLGPKRAPTPIPLETQPMSRIDDDFGQDKPLEDEWEWEIAVARARAQAEWADEAAQQAAGTPVVPAAAPPLRVRAKSPTAPCAVIATPPIADRWDTSDRTKTTNLVAPAPLPRITQPMRLAQMDSPVTEPGRTVIPVPTITQVTDPSQIKPRARVNTGGPPVRPNAAVMSPAPHRFPRATMPSTSTQVMQPFGEDTQVTRAAPANDDLTSPGLLLPASTSSNSKRAAAKQR